jgi:hypothetical protein
MYCLNLPIEVRFLLENIFIVGIIPGAPDVWTITHILISFVEMMNKFAPPGTVLPTYNHPHGVLVAARVLPLIADLQAIRKVAGYMAFNVTWFCNWCLLTLNMIEDLDYRSWQPRNSHTVSAQAKAWHDAITVTAKNALSKISGVRWSPVHDMFQWDPVRHIILGFMHNWLEGVLQRHLRLFWGIGRPKKKLVDTQDLGKLDDVNGYSQSEMSESSGYATEPENSSDSETGHSAGHTDPVPSMPMPSAMDVDEESDDSTTPLKHISTFHPLRMVMSMKTMR